MKKIFTLFAALMMVFSMFAANIPAGTKLYLTPNANWKQDNARFAAYFFGNGDAWVSMTKVEGETDLYEVVSPSKEFTNVIFCRMNPSASANNWNNKWNQTSDLTYNGTQNWYTVKEGTWDKGGGTWALYAPEAPKSYKDITITVVANATPKIHYWDGGDKVTGSEWETKPDMVATGEENTYSYTIKEVDEATGVKYLIVVGEIQSADQQAFDDVTINFKELLPQVAVMGVNNWDGTDKMTVADDYLSASVTLTLEAAKDYALKLTVNGEWFGSEAITITKDNNSAIFDTNGDNGKLTTDLAGDYVFTYTYATKTLVVTYPAPVEEEINYETFTMSNLAVTPMGDFDLLEASDDMMGLSVTLGVYADGSLHPASAVLFNGEELTIVEGNITKAYNDEVAADVYTARLVVEFMDGKLGLELLMYAGASASEIEVAIEGAEVTVDEATGTLQFTATWTDSTTMVTYPVLVTVAGYEEAEFKEYEGAQISELKIGGDGDDDPWLDFAVANAVAVFKDGNAFALEGEYTSWDTGTTYYVAIEGNLPVVEPTTITYELNGGELPAVVVPTNAELWEAFKPYYNEYYGLARADQPIDKVSTFAPAKMQEIMTDEASEYKWLGDYVQSVATAAGVPLSTDMASANEGGWRWAVHAFFNAAAGQYGASGIDFTEAGKPENWGPAYQAANALVLPTEPVAEDYTLPVPTKEGYTFLGWYDNAEGEGEAMTVIPAGWAGTLYAIWKAEVTEPTYEVYEDEITNFVFDLESWPMVCYGGPSKNFQVDVYLVLGEDNGDGTYALTEESSIAVMGSDATFIEGYLENIDAYAPKADAVIRCVWNGMNIEFHLAMSATPVEATVVVVENAALEVIKTEIFEGVYDYSLKMTGSWSNEADGLTYPVLVEIPVYYPEATEPSTIYSTVTVGSWDEGANWLGFGEGDLTVTTVDNVVTATGIVTNPGTGLAIDITISGPLKGTGTGLENATVTVKPVKMIQNGQLIIKKGDVEYNAQGAILK